MQIASPIFLIALFPWVALVLWLLLGKRRRVNVSFLELWKGPVSGPTARRRIGMPPLALLAILAALLLMILAASRPGIHRTASAADVPVVVGGIIPEADAAKLREAGVARVYTPKDFEISRIMGDIVDLVAERNGLAAAPAAA